MPITLDGTNGITTPMYNGSITANAVTPSVNMKNRIINGAMVIDQRNAGASVTPNNSSTTFPVDRFYVGVSQNSKLTAQRNAGSVTPPAGFTNYLGITSSSAYSINSTDLFNIAHRIEGFNTADLNWGTANAKTVTLSFWVRSSLTGTFGGSLLGAGGARAYPFSYTISSANTWEQKSITIAGDTQTGNTWNTTTGIGFGVYFSLGAGSTLSTTAGAWTSGEYYSATGATSVVGTNGATFYITGVQLEVGSTATSFDYRPYGTELSLCQRYLPAYRATSGGNQDVGTGQANGTTSAFFAYDYLVEPRVSPTGITVSSGSHFAGTIPDLSGSNAFTTLAFSVASLKRCFIQATGGSGLTSGTATFVRSQNASAYILFTGCEL